MRFRGSACRICRERSVRSRFSLTIRQKTRVRCREAASRRFTSRITARCCVSRDRRICFAPMCGRHGSTCRRSRSQATDRPLHAGTSGVRLARRRMVGLDRGRFSAARPFSARGMFRVYAKRLAGGFGVYVSPVNIDPAKPEAKIARRLPTARCWHARRGSTTRKGFRKTPPRCGNTYSIARNIWRKAAWHRSSNWRY